MRKHVSVPVQAGAHGGAGVNGVPAFTGMTKWGAVAE